MQNIFNRAERLLGTETMQRIAAKRVLIIGVGGVGSWCAESLVRSGIQSLTIVDSDCVCESNVNRQLMATMRTIGRPKVEALKERLLEINPTADITAICEIYSEERNALFNLDSFDYIIDCIDSLKDKMALLLNATKTCATVF
ncbi:MAG: ThiF family adenylyltransferase, partial [Prevotellaceae bacterium]|nr:ThiF family adenylyltransferase [Prevotellaceae bacterium]